VSDLFVVSPKKLQTKPVLSQLLQLEKQFFAKTLNVGIHDHRVDGAIFGEQTKHIADNDKQLAAYKDLFADCIATGRLIAVAAGNKKSPELVAFGVVEKYTPRLRSPQEQLASLLIGECFVMTKFYCIETETSQDVVQIGGQLLSAAKEQMGKEKMYIKFLRRGKRQNPVQRVLIAPLKPLTKKPTAYDLLAAAYGGRKAWRRTAEFPVAHENLTCEISSRVKVS